MNALCPKLEDANVLPPVVSVSAPEPDSDAGRSDAYLQLQRYAFDLQETLRAREAAYRQLFAYTQDLRCVIRERNAALAEARAAAGAKSRLIANVSHEFRTPLTAILGFTELLAGKSRDAGKKDLFSRVLAAARRIEGLVGNLLTLARLDTGSLPIRPESCNLAELVRDESTRFAERARVKGVEFALDVPTGPAVAEVDGTRLRQALAALLDNAVKFTAAGRITLTLRVDSLTGRPSRIDVADTGIGVAREHHQRIMESFEQVDGSSTRPFDGAGLGLTVAKSVLDLVGCQLEFIDDREVGSVFSIVLPEGIGAQPALFR